MLLNCSQPNTIIKEYYTNNIPDDATIVKVFPETGEPMLGSVFKSMNTPRMKTLITEQNDPEVDFANGILYYENSYDFSIANSINPDRTLNLSNIVGSKANIIYLMGRFVDGSEEEQANIYFKPFGYNVEYYSMVIKDEEKN